MLACHFCGQTLMEGQTCDCKEAKAQQELQKQLEKAIGEAKDMLHAYEEEIFQVAAKILMLVAGGMAHSAKIQLDDNTSIKIKLKKEQIVMVLEVKDVDARTV